MSEISRLLLLSAPPIAGLAQLDEVPILMPRVLLRYPGF